MKMKPLSLLVFCTLLLVPAIASAEVTDGNIGYGLTPGRLRTIAAAVVGLVSVVIGGLSLARSNRNGRARAIATAVLGLIAIILAGLHLATSSGGFGTGNGRAGAIVAIVVGLTGMLLAGLSFARSRRAG